MKRNLNGLILSATFSSLLLSCQSFMYGYIWNKAQNSYNLVTGNKDNGDKDLNTSKAL